MNKPNKVWIEFETVPPKDEAVKRMNKMLERFGIDMYFSIRDGFDLYINEKFGVQASKKLPDNGDWFNLDYLGRDD